VTPLDAVSVAIRERLLAGRPAPLPGLGTLVRHHVAARVEERPGGTRVMLPPGDTIGLAPSAAGEESLATAFARLRGLPAESAAAAYRSAMDQIEARLAVTGEVRLPGVGMLRRTSSGVVLGVEADLLAAVNRTYEGLAPVGAGGPEPKTEHPAPLPPPPMPPADAPRPPRPPAAPDDPFESVLDTPAVPTTPEPIDPVRDLASDFGTPEAPPQPAPPADVMGWMSETPFASPPPPETPAEAPSRAPAPVPSVPPPAPAPPAFESLAPGPPPPPAPDPSASAAEPSAPAPAPQPEPEPEPLGTPQAPPPPSPPSPPISATPPPYPAPEPPPASPEAPAASFVDESTLDDDLDAMLAIPFGDDDDTEIRDVLPPTPPAPSPAAPADADWTSQTWTAPSLADEALLPSEADLTYESVPEAEIEDADFDVVGASPAPPSEEVPEDAEPAPVLVERVGPDAELAAYLSEPGREPMPPMSPLAAFASAPPDAPQATAPVPVETTEDDASEAESSGYSSWWILVVLLLAVAVAALVWYWPELQPRLFPAAGQNAPTRTVDATRPLSADPAADVVPTDLADSLVAQVEPALAPAEDAEVPNPAQPTPTSARATPTASGGGVAADDDAPTTTRPGLGRAPAAGVAILPPRLAGLSDADIRALASHDAVDPRADAWTLVVLSTPSREDAAALVQRYRRAGYRTGALAASNGRTFRIGIGQFATRDDALRLRDRLPPEAPADTWLLSLRTL